MGISLRRGGPFQILRWSCTYPRKSNAWFLSGTPLLSIVQKKYSSDSLHPGQTRYSWLFHGMDKRPVLDQLCGILAAELSSNFKGQSLTWGYLCCQSKCAFHEPLSCSNYTPLLGSLDRLGEEAGKAVSHTVDKIPSTVNGSSFPVFYGFVRLRLLCV